MMPEHLSAKISVLMLLSNHTDGEHELTSLQDKVTQISVLLNQFPDLNRDVDVFRNILLFSENKNDLRKFRREQCAKFSITFENQFIIKIQDYGLIPETEMASILRDLPSTRFYETSKTFTIDYDCLEKISDNEFWNFIKFNQIRFLNIRTSKEVIITYDQSLLVQFIENEIPKSALSNLCTLKFEDGEMNVGEAALHLCGKWFKVLFSGRWNAKKEIDLTNVSKKTFEELLNVVGNGIVSPLFDLQQEVIHDFLEFSPARPVPEKSYGKEKWLTLWGDIGPVPLPPPSFFVALQQCCPFDNKNKDPLGLKKIDTHDVFCMTSFVDRKPFSVDLLEQLAENPKFGLSMSYDCMTDKIRKAIGTVPIKGVYWFIAPRKHLEETRNMDCVSQSKYLEENFPDYDFPFALEGLVYSFMPYCLGIREEITLGSKPKITMTACKEIVDEWQLALGGMKPSSGIMFNRFFHGRSNICVLPVQRFLR